MFCRFAELKSGWNGLILPTVFCGRILAEPGVVVPGWRAYSGVKQADVQCDAVVRLALLPLIVCSGAAGSCLREFSIFEFGLF